MCFFQASSRFAYQKLVEEKAKLFGRETVLLMTASKATMLTKGPFTLIVTSQIVTILLS